MRAHENIISNNSNYTSPINSQQSARQTEMPAYLQFQSTENRNKSMCNTMAIQRIHGTGFVKEFDSIHGCNLQFDGIDQIITIGNDLNPMSTMTTDTYSKMKHNRDAIGLIARGFHVYDILTVMIAVFNILSKLSILVLFSDPLTIVFIRMNLKLDKLSEFKYNSCNTTSITIVEIFNILSDRKFWLAAVFLMVRVMNTLPSIVTVSIEVDASVFSIDQLVLKLAIYLSNDAIGHTVVIRYVCCILFLCSFTVNIYIFKIICIDKLYNHTLACIVIQYMH